MNTLNLTDLAFVGGLAATAGYDTDVQAWIDARAAASDAVPTAYANAVNTYVLALKGVSGLWSAITQLVVPAGATTIAGAYISIKGNNFTGTNMVNGDVALKTGIKGNSTSKSLSTGYSGDFTGTSQNSLHIYTYVSEVPTGASDNLFGNGGTSTGATSLVYDTGIRCRSGTSVSVTGVGAGGYGVNRTTSTGFEHILAGTTGTATSTSQATNSGTFLVLARGGNANATPANWSDHRFLVYAMGGGITTLADYTTPTANLVTALNAI